jgi:hypothetical protein
MLKYNIVNNCSIGLTSKFRQMNTIDVHGTGRDLKIHLARLYTGFHENLPPSNGRQAHRSLLYARIKNNLSSY